MKVSIMAFMVVIVIWWVWPLIIGRTHGGILDFCVVWFWGWFLFFRGIIVSSECIVTATLLGWWSIVVVGVAVGG